jgi:predicted DNA-binding transcriptional regulator AlpA
MDVTSLAEETPFKRKSIYNQHSSGKGPLAPILVKLGGRLGCWRADYEAWKASQRRFTDKEAA